MLRLVLRSTETIMILWYFDPTHGTRTNTGVHVNVTLCHLKSRRLVVRCNWSERLFHIGFFMFVHRLSHKMQQLSVSCFIGYLEVDFRIFKREHANLVKTGNQTNAGFPSGIHHTASLGINVSCFSYGAVRLSLCEAIYWRFVLTYRSSSLFGMFFLIQAWDWWWSFKMYTGELLC